MPAFPFDPGTTSPASAYYTSKTDYYTAYYVVQDPSTQRVTVCAPTLEPSVGNSEICITR